MAASDLTGEQHFLDKHRNDLIQRITMVHPVLDCLLEGGLLTQEQYDIVKESELITQEKMRVLYKFISGWSFSDKDTLYQALKTSNPGVIENLEGHSQSENIECALPGDPVEDWKVQYMAVMKQNFQCVKEHNSRIGEAISLDRTFTSLLMVEGHQSRKEKEHEITSLGIRLQQTIDEASSDGWTHIPLQTLFKPNQLGVIPKIVVLKGPAGIGKTMTSKKIMLDWASGNFYQDDFSFAFYLSCRELNTITNKISLARLLSRTSKFTFPEDVIRSILSNPRKLLFIVDGFDEGRWALKDDVEGCDDPFQETHQEVLLRSLVTKQILSEASLIITTRPFALEKLDEFIGDVSSRHVEILGFTAENCEKYFYNSFNTEDDAVQALNMIKDNVVLYTMCAVPVTCWIVCTVLKQQFKEDVDLMECRTVTSIYLLYLKGLTKYHGRNQPVHGCLKKLCALANEGILNRHILFEEEDLERHGLSLSEVESVFLNENIFHQDIDSSTCYSFIHLSMQEFLAALYYLMKEEAEEAEEEEEKEEEEEEEAIRGQETFLPEICEGKSFLGLHSSSPHLSFVLCFLFGLTNEKQLKELSKITRRSISFRAAPALRNWLAGEDPIKYGPIQISCLYETQDEDFIRTVIGRSTDLEFNMTESKIFTRQLAYCLRFSPTIRALTFECNIKVQNDLEVLSPFLHKCSYLRIANYVLFSSMPCTFLRDLLIKSQNLKQLDLSEIHLRYQDVQILCQGLKHPDCTVQELSLLCDLNFVTCHDLHLITMSKSSLHLYVIFHMSSTMTVSEAAMSCRILQHPHYAFLNDSILHNPSARSVHQIILFGCKISWQRQMGPTNRKGSVMPCLGVAHLPILFAFGSPLICIRSKHPLLVLCNFIVSPSKT